MGHGLRVVGSDPYRVPARSATGPQQRVIPLRRGRRPRDQRSRRTVGKPIGEGAEVRGDDRDAGRQRDRKCVRICFGNLSGKPDNVGLLSRQERRKVAPFIFAVNGNCNLGPLGQRFGRRPEDAER